MGKITLTEREDGNYEFQAECQDSLLVVVLGSAYGRAKVYLPEKYGNEIKNYLDVVMDILNEADRTKTILLPKAKEYDEGSGDNLIEVYEIDKHEPT